MRPYSWCALSMCSILRGCASAPLRFYGLKLLYERVPAASSSTRWSAIRSSSLREPIDRPHSPATNVAKKGGPERPPLIMYVWGAGILRRTQQCRRARPHCMRCHRSRGYRRRRTADHPGSVLRFHSRSRYILPEMRHRRRWSFCVESNRARPACGSNSAQARH